MVAGEEASELDPAPPHSRPISDGSRVRRNRLVAAWVRMCRSSPICRPWAATENRSIGPDPRRQSASSGPATSRRNTRRSTAAGVSFPNQATSPGPWLMGENDRVPPASISTTNTGADGPMAVAMGTTVEWWLAGSRSMWSVSSPQPSAVTAARTELRNGSPMSSQAMAGPQWRIVRSPIPGTTSPAACDPHQHGHARVEAADDLGVGLVDGGPVAPVEPGQGGHQVEVAAGGDAPVDVGHGPALVADGVGEQGQAEVDDRHLRRQLDRRRRRRRQSGRVTASPSPA